MRHKKLTCSLLGAVVVITAASLIFFKKGPAAPKGRPAAQVETQAITTRTLTDSTSGYGSVKSLRYVTLKSLQTNSITQINFSGGERVKQGSCCYSRIPEPQQRRLQRIRQNSTLPRRTGSVSRPC
ncbi:efflux RND transporter periplasmic adaptor subunit [Dongshaea marina]|uniref:efflux RND transporter periplasmic adaptor subunit n=1 Tax=Dongshaea marina TaxID=2047966 RepID=UPI00131F32F4|nr:efflux RND transporter periplasmic adaptor subunit [Dongshaea marina]